MLQFFCEYFLAAAMGYTLGAIPFGYIIAKLRGINILRVGSGNPGATNVNRVLGRSIAIFVFLLDSAKGAIAAWLPTIVFAGQITVTHLSAIALMSAVLGHSFSLFLKFRGGKGVATTIGGFAVLMPNVLLMGVITWCVVFFVTHFVSLASICFALISPLCAYLFGYSLVVNVNTVALALFIVLRHWSNIRRIFSGTEPRAP